MPVYRPCRFFLLQLPSSLKEHLQLKRQHRGVHLIPYILLRRTFLRHGVRYELPPQQASSSWDAYQQAFLSRHPQRLLNYPCLLPPLLSCKSLQGLRPPSYQRSHKQGDEVLLRRYFQCTFPVFFLQPLILPIPVSVRHRTAVNSHCLPLIILLVFQR